MNGTDLDFLALSDDEILNMTAPPVSGGEAVPTNELEPEPESVDTPEPVQPEPELPETPETPETPNTEDEPETPETPTAAEEDQTPGKPESADPETPVQPEVPGQPEASKDTPQTKDQPETPPSPEDSPKEPDYKAFYDQVLGQPIRANGKDIKLNSPDEVIRMVQMGANYTKKMQALQPALRVVKMLENNQLLDEEKISYLIDLGNKNPDAIQKLLTDSKFDPLSVDESKAAAYTPGNHQVTDRELAFQAALDEIEISPTGVELIQEMAGQWDQESKRAVYQDPQIITLLNAQKQSGIYGRITEEVNRRRVLGELQGVPFLHAYKAVGDELHAQGRLAPTPAQPQVPAAPPPASTPPSQPEVPVATRVATPPSQVSNTARAKAAQQVKTAPSAPKREVNFLDLPDEEFLKQWDGRV